MTRFGEMTEHTGEPIEPRTCESCIDKEGCKRQVKCVTSASGDRYRSWKRYWRGSKEVK